ncbi:MAG: hypothetical protein M1818_001137 [Claussenomyces sp. TS43310]|nr:MAG: hypothetical protein M1818_001137 [Claussenomyces sp. TS43310]
MDIVDPALGPALLTDTIQRVLFVSPSVHVYNIPPLTSTKGYVAATWTENSNSRQIFTARLRVLETAVPAPNDEEKVAAAVLLEDPKTGDLFAAAPYTAASVVEQVLDSSRFFAMRVQDDEGRKAVLGIGFEERSEAFDFSVALQEIRKTLGFDSSSRTGGSQGRKPIKEKELPKKDFSLKEGETIVVNIGSKAGRGRRAGVERSQDTGSMGLSLPPPPAGGLLPPPPSAQEVKAQKRSSQTFVPTSNLGSLKELGFDDGEFGEFQ